MSNAYQETLCNIDPQTPSCRQVCASDWYDCLVSVFLNDIQLIISLSGEKITLNVLLLYVHPMKKLYESHVIMHRYYVDISNDNTVCVFVFQ